MRLKKSGLQSVILAGSSHLSRSVSGRITIGGRHVVEKLSSLARAARDFFKDLTFLACGPHGLPMGRFLASVEPNPCQGS